MSMAYATHTEMSKDGCIKWYGDSIAHLYPLINHAVSGTDAMGVDHFITKQFNRYRVVNSRRLEDIWINYRAHFIHQIDEKLSFYDYLYINK